VGVEVLLNDWPDVGRNGDIADAGIRPWRADHGAAGWEGSRAADLDQLLLGVDVLAS